MWPPLYGSISAPPPQPSAASCAKSPLPIHATGECVRVRVDGGRVAAKQLQHPTTPPLKSCDDARVPEKKSEAGREVRPTPTSGSSRRRAVAANRAAQIDWKGAGPRRSGWPGCAHSPRSEPAAACSSRRFGTRAASCRACGAGRMGRRARSRRGRATWWTSLPVGPGWRRGAPQGSAGQAHGLGALRPAK